MRTLSNDMLLEDASIRSLTQDRVPATVGQTGTDHDPLVALQFLMAAQGVATEPSRLYHMLGSATENINAEALVWLCRRHGLKARVLNIPVKRLEATPLPALAEMIDGTYILLAAAREDSVLLHDPATGDVSPLNIRRFAAAWTGRLVLVAHREALRAGGSRFGLTWFIPAVVKYRRLLGEVMTGSLVLQLFGLITPLFSQVVIDKVLVHHATSTLDVIVVGMLLISLFETLLGFLRGYVLSHTTNRVDVELGARMFEHLVALPLAWFQVRRVGDSVARVRELENVREFLTGQALTVVLDLLFTIVFLAVMTVYSGLLTLVVVSSLPLYVILSLAVTPVLRRRLDEKFRRSSENHSFLVESVGGMETLKAMAVEPQMRRKWEGKLAAYVSAAFAVTRLAMGANQVAELINKVSTAALLWIGARMAIAGDITVGELIAFNMLAGHVTQPVLRLAHLWQDFQQVRLSLARLGDILDAPAEPAGTEGQSSVPAIEGNVIFERVVFRYRPDAPEVLRGLSLAIRPGEAIGIVGPSGSGKSTLTKLVQRLYVPESGRVLIDGMDIAMLDPMALRRQIGVVLQENVLFTGTVRENIALADPGMPLERVVRAARLAGAHDFILELPHGYDAVVGERGTGLSGGQRQRIAIARALVTDPRLLIFDEATSALDAESERIIQNNMRGICTGRTVFIIAHRLSAVRACDRIVTVEMGMIVEEGTHGELLSAGGRYARLWQQQMGWRADDVDG